MPPRSTTIIPGEVQPAYEQRTLWPSFGSTLLPSLGSCRYVGNHYRSQLAEARR
jgi:hypothetical protein